MPEAIKDQDFKEKVLELSRKQPVLVDFWAEWCGPCKSLLPLIEKLSQDNKYSNVKFYKMNIDENENTPLEYKIQAIPTVIIFKDGEKVEQTVGGDLKKIISSLDKVISNNNP